MLKFRLPRGVVYPPAAADGAGVSAAPVAADALVSLLPSSVPLGPLHPGALGSGAIEEAVIPGPSPTLPVPPEGVGGADELPSGGAEAAAAGGGAAPPTAVSPAPAPSDAPMIVDAARLAVVTAAPTSANIVLPTSPRTIRLAMNGIKAMDTEKRHAVMARSIIWLEPTKLFRTPFAFKTELMLLRFTADMRT